MSTLTQAPGILELLSEADYLSLNLALDARVLNGIHLCGNFFSTINECHWCMVDEQCSNWPGTYHGTKCRLRNVRVNLSGLVPKRLSDPGDDYIVLQFDSPTDLAFWAKITIYRATGVARLEGRGIPLGLRSAPLLTDADDGSRSITWMSTKDATCVAVLKIDAGVEM